VRATEKFSCPLIVLSFILISLRADWLEVKLAVHASRLLSDAAGASRALPRAGSVAAGFVRAYVFSTDHKMIARQFLFLGLVMMLLGGLLAMLIRWELAWPETSIRWLRWIPEPYLYDGIIPPETYNMLFTMHATLMIFFVLMPILVGAFGNFLIPLMLGARDMAFPRLNMLSFWTGALAGLIMFAGFFVPGGHAATGWTAYAPLAAVPGYTGTNWGQNLWCISLFVLGISSMMGSINYITTVINMRAPGMTFFRMPLVVWALFITAPLALLALPVLMSAVAMLFFDRSFGTSWFTPGGGGEPLLWQHLFWYFGHPEVYILILPAMGITSEILPVFTRKPIFGYHAMVFSMIAIAFLSWVVYGHHMFVSAMNPALAMSFMVTTMIIAVPSAIKVFNWLGTLWGGRIRFAVPMLYALAFVGVFVIGGLSGLHGLRSRRHLHPWHLFHRGPYPLRPVWRLPVRGLCGDLLLVPQDVRSDDEPFARASAFLADLHLLQPDVLPDAHPRPRRPHAPDLQPNAV
jgi:cytochrome c oxidase subunit 1